MAIATPAGGTTTLTISSTNMEPALKPGTVVTVSPVHGVVAREWIIEFRQPPGWPDGGPNEGSDSISRVIGVGGDAVSCKHDVLHLNGRVLNQPRLYPGSHPCSADDFEGKTSTVPSGDLFVMGDHRDFSFDSRAAGFVPVSDVIGHVTPGLST